VTLRYIFEFLLLSKVICACLPLHYTNMDLLVPPHLNMNLEIYFFPSQTRRT